MTVTDLFLSLTPERVLEAVEAGGLRCNPVCHALNSFENRVYDVELDDLGHVVAKFYRPGRWSEAQIREEHAFMRELEEDEVPICGHRTFPDGSTLKRVEGIWYCLYDRRGGRAPDEFTDEDVERLGMLVARMHNVGARRDAPNRLRLDADTYIREELGWLLANGVIPEELRARYTAAADAIADLADRELEGVPVHRVHGDFHPGNLLVREGRYHLLDFDDMVVGPAVQDLWMILPGRDATTRAQREVFLEAYETFRAFDRRQLKLIELLRGLRLVRYAAWLARRWHDPVFPLTWPQFGTLEYWTEQTTDLEDLLVTIRQDLGEVDAAPAPEPDAADAELFWDWEDIQKRKGS